MDKEIAGKIPYSQEDAHSLSHPELASFCRCVYFFLCCESVELTCLPEIVQMSVMDSELSITTASGPRSAKQWAYNSRTLNS